MVGSWGREVVIRQAQGPDCDAVMVWGRPSTGSGTEW